MGGCPPNNSTMPTLTAPGNSCKHAIALSPRTTPATAAPHRQSCKNAPALSPALQAAPQTAGPQAPSRQSRKSLSSLLEVRPLSFQLSPATNNHLGSILESPVPTLPRQNQTIQTNTSPPKIEKKTQPPSFNQLQLQPAEFPPNPPQTHPKNPHPLNLGLRLLRLRLLRSGRSVALE